MSIVIVNQVLDMYSPLSTLQLQSRLCYYICWEVRSLKPCNRIKLQTAQPVRPVTTQSATLSGFFYPSSVPLFPCPPVWVDLVIIIVITTTPTSGSPYLFSWGRIVLVWWDQFWLPGRPARHHQTKPCWQPSYWSLRSPVSSSPVTPDCQIISFRSHFSFHPLARMAPLSHPAQF